MNVVESALAENSNDQDKKDENNMTSATEMNSEEDKLALAAEFWVNELKKDEPILENPNDQQHQNTFTAQKNVITLSEIKYDEVNLIFRARVNFSEESNGHQPLMEIPSGNHQGDNEDFDTSTNWKHCKVLSGKLAFCVGFVQFVHPIHVYIAFECVGMLPQFVNYNSLS